MNAGIDTSQLRVGLNFGLALGRGSGTWAQSVGALLDSVGEFEQMGYDSLHLTEHHFMPDGHNPSPLMTLAAVAARTSAIRLVTNILLAPLYNPVKLAEDSAVLDNISSGRLTLGLAPGYVRHEFAGLGVPYEERVGRFLETVQILRRAWTDETFSFTGRHFAIPETRLTPRPVQTPHPPIWFGVSGPRLLNFAAAEGLVFTASPRHSTAEIQEHLATYRSAGTGATEFPIIRGTFVAPTREEAERIAAPAVIHLFREVYGKNSVSGDRLLVDDFGVAVTDLGTVTYERFAQRFLIGTPDDVLHRVRDLRASVAPTELACWMELPGITPAQVQDSVSLFASAVLPNLD